MLAVELGPTVTPESKSVENGRLVMEAPCAVTPIAMNRRGENLKFIGIMVGKVVGIERSKVV